MEVGILGGTGPAGRGLALRLAAGGCVVRIGSRSAERAAEVVTELLGAWPGRDLDIRGVANERAADADIVVLATPWDSAAQTAASLSGALAGKVLVSMANAIAPVSGELQPLYLPRGSVAESVAAVLPSTTVAAAFHHLPARELGLLDRAVEGDVLVCSDEPAGLEAVAELVARMPDLRAIETGSLSSATALEAFTAVLLQINRRYRSHAAIAITGVDVTRGARSAGAAGRDGSR